VYCQYHQDKGHTTEECKTLQSYLNHLVREGKLEEFTNETLASTISGIPGRASTTTPLGTIHVILVEPKQMPTMSIGVMSMSLLVINFNREDLCKRARTGPNLVMGFSDEDLVNTAQPHVDALVVTM